MRSGRGFLIFAKSGSVLIWLLLLAIPSVSIGGDQGSASEGQIRPSGMIREIYRIGAATGSNVSISSIVPPVLAIPINDAERYVDTPQLPGSWIIRHQIK